MQLCRGTRGNRASTPQNRPRGWDAASQASCERPVATLRRCLPPRVTRGVRRAGWSLLSCRRCVRRPARPRRLAAAESRREEERARREALAAEGRALEQRGGRGGGRLLAGEARLAVWHELAARRRAGLRGLVPRRRCSLPGHGPALRGQAEKVAACGELGAGPTSASGAPGSVARACRRRLAATARIGGEAVHARAQVQRGATSFALSVHSLPLFSSWAVMAARARRPRRPCAAWMEDRFAACGPRTVR